MSEAAAAGCVSIDILEYEGGLLRIDGNADGQLLKRGTLSVRINGADVPVHWSERRAQAVAGKEVFSGRVAFASEICIRELSADNILKFIWRAPDGEERRLPILAANYQARLHSDLKKCWWSFGTGRCVYLVTWADDRSLHASGEPAKNGAAPYALRIRRAGYGRRIRQELGFLGEILCAENGSRKMFLMRCQYWLAYPAYMKKNIWITFDKLYKGGDCGEYFYKYLCSRTESDIIPVYVIRGDAPDYRRLQGQGYHPAAYRSKKQRLAYLFASMVFGTHSGVNSFCGFNNWEIRFVQDRLRAVNTCIQHGLSVQDLSADSNRAVNNNKRYYCASSCEIENLSRPAYDYAPETLRLTGIPRYDGLVNDDRRQILITPTWRAYLAVQSVMGEARGYNPEFRNTQYFQLFQSLLDNEKLRACAKECGYRIIYLLHPVISAQKKDFREPEGVKICTALDTDYETILTQSSLMVTDYSGVQFDFAYMRKPVVYFHPKELPPHYGDGGFDYEKQGFGEICATLDVLVDTLCDYMRRGCSLKEVYRARQDAFFAYSDQENCRRIYEDARRYQEEARSRKETVCSVSDSI
ncbi:CDP-glycerol glycerophosphotransferase family protein [Parablautia sp. Marseille-Q6255]|uniref:CDP-glycerol glycerophosphotransferase family protein n=1 Tax=Parablautia sp. Marseille-Q6255 TaxID=3039593 RepID=UPI0024BC1A6F|nr:CDP-glycerol glycerophosphotransferase family protein [Parablautia sp. Marseille-Q6255]